MCAARRQRLSREAIGGSEVPFPENTIRNITVVALVLLVAIAATPAPERRQMAASAIDARIAHDVPVAKLSAEARADDNVVDLTY